MIDERNPEPGLEADPVRGAYHFLDVGEAKYGECILIEFASKRILIDGSHQQDFRGQSGRQSIPQQLDAILGPARPHEITLLVVTHGHADHVGCLPDLLDHGVIRARYALLTDESLGFGRTHDEDRESIAKPVLLMEAALREEDASDLNDDEVSDFIDAANAVEPRYRRFIQTLIDAGTHVHQHRGEILPEVIRSELADTGIELLGPSLDLLLLCAEQISRTNKEAADAVADLSDDAGARSMIDLYRRIVNTDHEDAGFTRGNAMNCQSITLAFGPPGERVLLAGDMQFAEPGVRGADEAVAALRRAVVAAGPFSVFKSTHHTAHNGQDEALISELGNPGVIVHSGGSRDESHPNRQVLEFLQELTGTVFARTDRNGIISVHPANGNVRVDIQHGSLDDFGLNILPDDERPSTAATGEQVASGPSTEKPSAANNPGVQVVIINLPPGDHRLSVAGVEIIVGDPATIRGNDGQIPATASASAASMGRASGSRSGDGTSYFSGLIFVTNPDMLATNIGHNGSRLALETIERRGGFLVTQASRRAVLAGLESQPQARGVVIVGGHDIVPMRPTNVLDPELRRLLGSRVLDDADEYVVWSDKAYADTDNDAIADLPVSRIPDARDATLVLTALSPAHPAAGAERFGIRNVARPFAATTWSTIPGKRRLNISGPYVNEQMVIEHLDASIHYYMLHGSHSDGRYFTGEDPLGPMEAFSIESVPEVFAGTVFTGCCWGAMIVDGLASGGDLEPAPRLPENSIALAYLRAGARAFVGCTGAHYSGPSVDPGKNYALTLHRSFLRNLVETGAPARALFDAKAEFGASILRSGDSLDAVDIARRLKNLEQFTCLGLGW